MATYRWFYVESGTTRKTLKLYLCQGQHIVREGTDINYSYQLERQWKEDLGHKFEDSISDFLDMKKRELEGKTGGKMIFTITPRQFKDFLKNGKF